MKGIGQQDMRESRPTRELADENADQDFEILHPYSGVSSYFKDENHWNERKNNESAWNHVNNFELKFSKLHEIHEKDGGAF